MSEMELVNDIIEWISIMGGKAIRINAGLQIIKDGSGKSRAIHGAPAGTSDILVCWCGRFVAIECKIGSNKPTQLQQDFINDIKDKGGKAVVVWSLDEAINYLEALGKPCR
jgi:hypothetical protein